MEIVLAYDNRDRDIGSLIVKQLESDGYSVHDSVSDAHVTGDWREGIKSAIRNSRMLVIVVPPEGLEESWLAYEVGVAEALGKKILLVSSKPEVSLPQANREAQYTVYPLDLARLRQQAARPVAAAEALPCSSKPTAAAKVV